VIEGSDLELFERSLRQATGRHTGAALDAALADLGWTDALSVDPQTAVARLFALQGATNATSSALGQVVAHGLGLDPDPGLTVALPALGSWDRPGTLDAGGLSVHGLSAGAPQSRVLVVAGADGLIVETRALTAVPVEGIDPAFGLGRLSGKSIAHEVHAPRAGDRWDEAVALARLAVGYELTGAARSMLGLACEHALDRIQFGQPIARFQAVRHRLAEALVAIESAEAVLNATWECPSPELASCAKSLAGRGARTAAKHCQQVLAGIGFTAEHPFHRHFRRVVLLDQLFGSAHSLTEELGHQFLAGRRLPALLPL
jgi:hypothetical protein